MSDSPKVSVLIPTYQYARFLPEAIESILAQEFADFELLISDDASSDGSGEIIRRYAARDPRVRAQVHPKNIGMVANWNWCLSQARGQYVKYVFGDDCLTSPKALGGMVAMLEAEPRAVIAATARIILDGNSNALEIWNELGADGHHRGGHVIMACLQRDRNLVGEPSAVLFRRAAAERGFDPALRQLVDQEMWFHLLSHGDLVYSSEPLCAFRQHPAQQTAVNRASKIATAESLWIMVRYFDYLAASSNLRPNSLTLRRQIFRCLYYTRKDSPEMVDLAGADKALLEKLTLRWYIVCWVLHRCTKPWINFHRHFRKLLGRTQAPQPLPQWQRQLQERRSLIADTPSPKA